MPIDHGELARIGEKARNTERWLEHHIQEDTERFERVFAHIKEEFGKMDRRFDKFEETLQGRLEPTEDKVETLWDSKNKQAGAFSIGKWVIGIIGGLVGAILGKA